MATYREMLEGYLLPPLVYVLGARRFAKFVVSQGRKAAKQGACRLARWPHGGSGRQADGVCVEGDDGVR